MKKELKLPLEVEQKEQKRRVEGFQKEYRKLVKAYDLDFKAVNEPSVKIVDLKVVRNIQEAQNKKIQTK